MTWTIRGVMGALGTWLAEASGRFAATLSTPGLLLATLFFAASLTPSLLPRPLGLQGILSGVSLAAGYGLGVFGRWLWGYLELPVPGPRTHRIVTLTAAALCLATALLFLRQAAEWQNSVRLLMELDPADTAHPFRLGIVAALVAGGLLTVGRFFGLVFGLLAGWFSSHLPRRVANVAGVVAAVALFWVVLDGVLFQRAFRGLDASFQQVDALVEPQFERPTAPLRTGSSSSLLDWDDLGRRGREFVASGPNREALMDFVEDDEAPVLDPIRVYVGLNSAETIQERVRLALEELKRVGAFDRSTLVIATPTGTGWLDPKALDPLEYLHRGDVATVAVQYSYLASWLSLLVEPEHGDATVRALFSEVYSHWTDLPEEERPNLYLYGLSLGALNSERSADLFDVIGDPFQGALWAGPPFRSTTWRTITDEREPNSPAWLPRFRDGSVVRFANQEGGLEIPGVEWGPLRIVYLQYASDPITFFEGRALFRQPGWMEEPRAPDVSPELRWYPVVTVLQLAVDIVTADVAPVGYGHVYAPDDYIDAWIAVTNPPDWSPEQVERLKEHFKEHFQDDEEEE